MITGVKGRCTLAELGVAPRTCLEARRCIRLQISEHELNAPEEKVAEIRRHEKRRRMTQCSEEHPAFAVTMDPAERVVSVLTHAGPRTAPALIQVRLFDVHAHQNMHLVTRQRSFNEAIKLVLMDE